MNELKKGFEFAIEHSLSLKEMELLLDFAENNFSSTALANHRNAKLSATHAIITKLKLKKLIVVDCQDGQHKIYRLSD